MTPMEPLQWINTEPELDDLARRCLEVGRMALDTEADSLHSYYHKTCLIQVSVEQHTALIDPLALRREGMESLFRVLADPEVQVLMHGSDYDMRVLDRDFGAHVSGLIDTQEMALILGEEKTGLAALLEKEFGIVLKKKYQRADWGQRPLSDEMLAYAASDTMHLEALVTRLRKRLEDMGRWNWALEEFHRLEQVRYCEREADPCSFERVKGGSNLRGPARDRLFTLYQWREKRAQSRDVPPFKVLGNRALVELAELEDDPTPDVLESVTGVGPRLARRFGRELGALIREPSRAPVNQSRRRRIDLDRAQRARLKKLLLLRDRLAEQLKIQGGLLCSRGLAQAIAMTEPLPDSRRALEEAGLKGWRLTVLGETFLDAFDTSEGSSDEEVGGHGS